MKLFLTSSGLSDTNTKDFLNLLGKDPHGLKVAFIPTAMNPESEETKEKYIPQDVADLENLGMIVVSIDLESLTEDTIIEAFQSFDIVYVYGGNTFYLMNEVNRSGFKTHIQEIIKDKVYVGVSAGSIIAGPDISIAGWPEGDCNDIGLKDMTGLSLVSYVIQPHWHGQISLETESCPFEVKSLKDGEAIIEV